MKPINLQHLFYLFISLAVVAFTSCNDEDKNTPISLFYEYGTQLETNELQMTPFQIGYTFTIQGGDGKYVVDCTTKEILEVVEVDYNGKTITLTPKAVGTATLTIEDNSGQSYTLSIKVAYAENIFTVLNTQCVLYGEKLSPQERTELQMKANATYPIQVQGGYKFVFTTRYGNEGKVFIYPQSQGWPTYIEGTFKWEYVQLENNVEARLFNLQLEGKEIKLYFSYKFYNFQMTDDKRALPPPRDFYMMEDMTGMYKVEYPELDAIYVVQTLSFKN